MPLVNYCVFLSQSLGALGAAFGAPCAWPISNILGRKPSLMLGGVTGLVGWLVVTYADLIPSSKDIVTTLYIGRFITGLAGGWLIYSVSVSTFQSGNQLYCYS